MKDISTIIQRHNLTWQGPNPDFFEGMLLGNGDIGVCVTVRPDGIVLHLGKNDVWDIRVSEEHVKHLLPFKEVLSLLRRASERMKVAGLDRKSRFFFALKDKEYEDYIRKLRSSYAKAWPRPWPCGRVIVRWDPRKVVVKEQRLNIYTGLLTIPLEVEGKDYELHCFVHRDDNQVWLWGEGDIEHPFTGICYRPFVSPETDMPEPEIWKEIVTHASEPKKLFRTVSLKIYWTFLLF